MVFRLNLSTSASTEAAGAGTQGARRSKHMQLNAPSQGGHRLLDLRESGGVSQIKQPVHLQHVQCSRRANKSAAQD